MENALINRKKINKMLADTNHKQIKYDVSEGDDVVLTIHGTIINGVIKTNSGSYFLLPGGNHITDPDVFVKKFEPRKGKHA